MGGRAGGGARSGGGGGAAGGQKMVRIENPQQLNKMMGGTIYNVGEPTETIYPKGNAVHPEGKTTWSVFVTYGNKQHHNLEFDDRGNAMAWYKGIQKIARKNYKAMFGNK